MTIEKSNDTISVPTATTMQQRLQDLRQEYNAGETKLRELERQAMYVRETMLRISGAIQVLEELTATTPESHTKPLGTETQEAV